MMNAISAAWAAISGNGVALSVLALAVGFWQTVQQLKKVYDEKEKLLEASMEKIESLHEKSLAISQNLNEKRIDDINYIMTDALVQRDKFQKYIFEREG